MKKTKIRTSSIIVNGNISFPVGTKLAVDKYFEKLGFFSIFSKLKHRGISLPNLVGALISYRLSENQSLSKASDWINRVPVLDEFKLEKFEQRTLFREIEILGDNYEEIILDIQDSLFSLYDFEYTDINMDWSSLILWGDKSSLGKYGYSRDHRPDKKQITFGVSELRNPINIPIGFTIGKGNLNDMNHFQTTFDQVKGRLNMNSRVIFDKGGNSKTNLNSVIAAKMKFLTSKKFNKSDDSLIKNFWNNYPTLINLDKGIVGFKHEFPTRTNYFFFSKYLETEQIESKIRKANRFVNEAKEIEKSINNKKKLPKKFQISNPLINIKYTYQTKLSKLSEKDAFNLAKKASITGREGFFCLTSSENLTLNQALELYRQKDSVEKIMHSLKNEICIKPLRVWTGKSIHGALLIGYLAQLIISLIRYDNKELKKVSTKFIKTSLSNLTVTIEISKSHKKRKIYSNFDPINELICLKNTGIT